MYSVAKDEQCAFGDEVVLHMAWFGARDMCIKGEDYYLEDCSTVG